MKKVILLLTLMTLVVFVSGALAQPKPAPAKPAATPAPAPAPAPAAPEKVTLEKFSGAIEKVDEMAKAIVVKDKKGEKNFVTDDKTKITKGKETLSFTDLKKGMRVAVEYKKDGDKLVAVSVKVATPKAAPKKEEPKK